MFRGEHTRYVPRLHNNLIVLDMCRDINRLEFLIEIMDSTCHTMTYSARAGTCVREDLFVTNLIVRTSRCLNSHFSRDSTIDVGGDLFAFFPSILN